MSLAGLWSENFFHLRNTIGGCYCLNLIRYHGGESSRSLFGTNKWMSRRISTKAEESKKSQGNKPCTMDLNLPGRFVGSTTSLNINKVEESPEFKDGYYCNVHQNISRERGSQWPLDVLVFDIETTGFRKDKDRIIEIAIRNLRGGKNSTFQSLVNPGIPIENTYVHKISTAMVNNPDVPRFRDLAPILLEYVGNRPILWVAHNCKLFDVPFLVNEFSRCSLEVPENWLFLDTLPLARQLVTSDGNKLPSARLESLGIHYRIQIPDQTHRAMPDVVLLSNVFQRMTFDLKLSVDAMLKLSFKASDLKPSAPRNGRGGRAR
ncbi:hypothetical protein QJS10_CPA16g01600 [Acorus calamus]|uniref:Exonuclease domain-containing protein n=1 Tax=Acorus calamus TaxID=4465 RepID=A0AAV9D1Q3_ACOCL|nr:hypothetical protein QJS10_CPA16g01600 [Acorus calamus]